MERAGRSEKAFRGYEAALEVAPECVAAMQGAAVCALSSGRADPRVDGWLRTIALRGETPAWRSWGTRQASTRPNAAGER